MNKKFLGILSIILSLAMLVGCGGSSGGNNPPPEEVKLTKALLMSQNWYVDRNTTKLDPTTEVKATRLITYKFNTDGTYTTHYSDTSMTFKGTWSIEDDILFASYTTAGTSLIPSVTINYRGELINDHEIRWNVVGDKDYSILSKNKPSFNEKYKFFANTVTASMLQGTWVYSRESHPDDYSKLIKVNPSPKNGYIDTWTFKNDGTGVAVVCNDMTLLDAPITSDGPKKSPEGYVYGEWNCEDTTTETINMKWSVSGNQLHVTDGKDSDDIYVECNGSILYQIFEGGKVSEFTKK